MHDNNVYTTREPVIPVAGSESFEELFAFLNNSPTIMDNGLIEPEPVQECLTLLDTAWPPTYNTDLPVLPVRTAAQLQRLMLYLVAAGFREQNLTYDQPAFVSEDPASKQRSPSGPSSAGNDPSSTASSSSSFTSPPLKRKRAPADDAEESAPPSLKEQLARLQEWLDAGVIEQEEYAEQRRETINAARVRK